MREQGQEQKQQQSNRRGSLIAGKDIKLGKVLGEGGFGIVYKATWMKFNQVAVKQVNIDFSAYSEKKIKALKDALRSEAQLLKTLHCPQIIRYFGVSLDSSYQLVMEYAEKGSLFSVLHSDQALS